MFSDLLNSAVPSYKRGGRDLSNSKLAQETSLVAYVHGPLTSISHDADEDILWNKLTGSLIQSSNSSPYLSTRNGPWSDRKSN